MKPVAPIDAYIFDFGNVIINIDFQLMRNKFRGFLGKQYDATFYGLTKNHFFQKVESGTYTAEKMADMINEYGATITPEQVKEAWNALLLDLPVERLQLLDELTRHFPIYLLSNTNLVHIEQIFGDLETKYGYNPIKSSFDQLYLSYEIGYIKPQREIYEYVINDANLNPEKTLFFDDLQENLDGAAALGIQTQLVTKDFGIIEFFSQRGLTWGKEIEAAE